MNIGKHHPVHRRFMPRLLVPAIVVSASFWPHHTLAAATEHNSHSTSTDSSEGTYPFWHEASGLTAFDGSRRLLLVARDDSIAAPMIQESGPLLMPSHESPARSNRSSFRIDMTTHGLVTSRWRPGRLPLEILEFQPVLTDETRFRWRYEAGFLVALTGGFYLYQRTIVDSDRAVDPTARVGEYDEIEASVEIPAAVIGYHCRAFTAQVGRRWRRWGPGWTGSLVLGEYHPPADGFDLAYTAKRWSARYSFERLDDVDSGETPDLGRLHRYLAAHRLDVQLHAKLRLGLTETSLVAADGPPPFWTLNPLLPWALTQQERGSSHDSANILWSIDAAWNPGPGWSLYGQFLLDDYQIDSEDRETYPDQLGWLAGLIWQSGLPVIVQLPASSRGTVWSAGLEYTRLSTWTYVHRDPPVRYQGWGAPLGHPAGPDSETLSGFWEWRHPARKWRLLVVARWRRKGRIDLDTPEESTGQVGQPFPSPPVTKLAQVATIASVTGPARTIWEGRIGWHDTTGEDGQGWYATLSLTWPFWNWQPIID